MYVCKYVFIRIYMYESICTPGTRVRVRARMLQNLLSELQSWGLFRPNPRPFPLLLHPLSPPRSLRQCALDTTRFKVRARSFADLVREVPSASRRGGGLLDVAREVPNGSKRPRFRYEPARSVVVGALFVFRRGFVCCVGLACFKPVGGLSTPRSSPPPPSPLPPKLSRTHRASVRGKCGKYCVDSRGINLWNPLCFRYACRPC